MLTNLRMELFQALFATYVFVRHFRSSMLTAPPQDVSRQECRPVTKEVCTKVTNQVPKEECRKVPREVCEQVDKLLGI